MASIGDGRVDVSFESLNEKDLKAILLKCSPRRELRPRKCRRTTMDSNICRILSKLPINNITCLNLIGNQIGDAGTEHFHLIPSTVHYLNLSDCGIGSHGAKNICDFMKTNDSSITQLVMWGNDIGDEGAACIADMLCQNKTLRELSFSGRNLGVEAFSHISRGLAHNM